MMKYIKMAEGAAGLFEKKTEVVLEKENGEKLGTYKLEESQVPEKFNKPLVIEVKNVLWRILAAQELREKSILRSRKVLLIVIEAESYQNGRFMSPTYAHPSPETGIPEIPGKDYLFLSKEEWRQFEFLPPSMNTIMLEELSMIENIINFEINKELLLGFEKIQIRETIGEKIISISYEEMKRLLEVESEGKVKYNGEEIRNSFFIRTPNNTFYGVIEEGIIKQLCLFDFQSVDDEFMVVTATFDLVMADWCNAGYYFIDLNATDETSAEDQSGGMSII